MWWAHGAWCWGAKCGAPSRSRTSRPETSLATGIRGEAGEQNQIMRTPHLMEEPVYSAEPAGPGSRRPWNSANRRWWKTRRKAPRHPTSMQQASQTVLLIPGHNLTNDGIVLHLYGYILQIEHPKPGQALIAKDDVTLRASVRPCPGTLVRPHGGFGIRARLTFTEKC